MPNGKPNILVIWGDDIGITNLSCYSDGLMGFRTAQTIVGRFLETFKEFPPRRKAASFTIDQALQKMQDSIAGSRG
jgi:arylsulfatase A-like enzyme